MDIERRRVSKVQALNDGLQIANLGAPLLSSVSAPTASTPVSPPDPTSLSEREQKPSGLPSEVRKRYTLNESFEGQQ
jgi:hypothetical protein